MTSFVDATPVPGLSAESATFEAFHLTPADDDRLDSVQDISERRARWEDPEALRLARSL